MWLDVFDHRAVGCLIESYPSVSRNQYDRVMSAISDGSLMRCPVFVQYRGHVTKYTYSHTHTYTHTHTHTYCHTNNTRTHLYTHRHIHCHTNTQTHSHKHTHTRTHSQGKPRRKQWLIRTCIHTYIQKVPCTHACTHTHTHLHKPTRKAILEKHACVQNEWCKKMHLCTMHSDPSPRTHLSVSQLIFVH